MDNGGALQVVRKRICMTQDQVRMYHDSLVVPQLFSPQSFKLSLDNIVTGDSIYFWQFLADFSLIFAHFLGNFWRIFHQFFALLQERDVGC